MGIGRVLRFAVFPLGRKNIHGAKLSFVWPERLGVFGGDAENSTQDECATQDPPSRGATEGEADLNRNLIRDRCSDTLTFQACVGINRAERRLGRKRK